MDYIDHRGHTGPLGISHAMHQFPPETAHQPLLSESDHQLKRKTEMKISRTYQECAHRVRKSFPESSAFQYPEKTIAGTETNDTSEKSP